MTALRDQLRRHWGSALLAALSLLALLRLLRQTVPGHYRVFTGAGAALLRGENPYGTDFGTSVGYYFYSPTCALTIFGPLSRLPERLGLIVYMVASWIVFGWGARKLWRCWRTASDTSIPTANESSLRLQWFWALLAAQMVGGILASKLEIAITGLLMGSVAMATEAWPLREHWHKALTSALLLAAILNWKFQPLPVVGLFGIAWLVSRRDWRLPALIVGCLGFWYALPWLFFSGDFLRGIHDSWQATFSHFVAESFLNFENVFATLKGVTGYKVSFATSQVLSGLSGLAFAGIVLRSALAGTGLVPLSRLAVGLGALFMASFSPLGQNNALILYAPLLLAALSALDPPGTPRGRRDRFVLGIACATMILAYSDAVPQPWRDSVRALSVKPIACLLLGWVLARAPRPPGRHPSAA